MAGHSSSELAVQAETERRVRVALEHASDFIGVDELTAVVLAEGFGIELRWVDVPFDGTVYLESDFVDGRLTVMASEGKAYEATVEAHEQTRAPNRTSGGHRGSA